MRQNKEITYLTGLRGVAVLIILFVHMFNGHAINRPMAYLGMSIFFVLSGTVLTYTWADKFSSGKSQLVDYIQVTFSFLWARFARLAPLYLILVVPYFAHTGQPWKEIGELLPRYFLGMQSWFYDVNASGAIKQLTIYSMSWSISSECWLYLIFPVLFIFLYNCKHHTRWYVAAGFYFVYLASLVLLVKKGIYAGTGYPPSQTEIDWFVYLSPYGRVIEFMMGMLMGLTLLKTTQAEPRLIRSSFHGALALSLIGILITYLAIIERKQSSDSLIALLRMGPLFTLPISYLMYALVRGNDLVEKLFSSKILIIIGTWSYSIYLWQEYLLHLIGSGWRPGPHDYIMHIINVVFVLLLSAGSYQIIEAPARGFLIQLDPVKNLFPFIERRMNTVTNLYKNLQLFYNSRKS